MKRTILALICAFIASPAVGQKISTLPAASTLTASDQSQVLQGSGCATQVQPCVNGRASMSQLASYVATDTSIASAYAKITGAHFTGSIQIDGDVYATRLFANGTANSGTIYMGSNGQHYIYYNGSDYHMPGGGLAIDSGSIAVNGDVTYAGSAGTIYTPTVSCGSGSLSSVTATAKYKQIGKMVFLKGMISIGSSGNGSCAGSIVVSIPFPSSNDNIPSNGSGRENAATGKQLQVVISPNTNTAVIFNFDNSYPGGNGYVLVFSITYEAQ